METFIWLCIAFGVVIFLWGFMGSVFHQTVQLTPACS